MFNRMVNPSKNNSFFIFGARGTGKSTWLEWKFESIPHLYIDLLNLDEEERLAKDPGALLAQVKGLDQKTRWIVIDEIQKLPKLLDVVHLCIDKDRKSTRLNSS